MTARKDTVIRQQHDAITRIRNIDPTPPIADPDTPTGRAYTHGWQAHAAAVETALVDLPDSRDTGPSVREAAADDRAHWADKYAGEGP